MKEEWRVIGGFSAYLVSNTGRVKRRFASKNGQYPAGYILKHSTCRGYHRTCLSSKGKKYTISVHRLVATAFVSNPHNKPAINHKDGVKSNNVPTNIEFCTNQENMDHAVKMGLLRPNRGEKSATAKLTDKDVTIIKRLIMSKNMPHWRIARIFGVREPMISRIKFGRRWAHHTCKGFRAYKGPSHAGENAGGVKLKDGEVWLIKRLLSLSGLSHRKISEMFSIGTAAINNISRGTTWTHIAYP